MDRKIIDFPTQASQRRAKPQASRPQSEVVELTMTIPKAEPGPSTVRY
jgi:hypothetical protein